MCGKPRKRTRARFPISVRLPEAPGVLGRIPKCYAIFSFTFTLPSQRPCCKILGCRESDALVAMLPLDRRAHLCGVAGKFCPPGPASVKVLQNLGTAVGSLCGALSFIPSIKHQYFHNRKLVQLQYLLKPGVNLHQHCTILQK